MRIIGGLGVSVLALGVCVAAQSRDPIRVSTRLVQVHVVVQDRDRNPVRDLTAKDFRLTDDGKDQTIALFEVESSEPPASESATRPTPGGSANTFANDPGTTGSVTAILIDQLNTGTLDQLGVRKQAITFLEQVQPGDRIGVYVLDHSYSLRVVHDFTSDTQSLARVVARMKTQTSNEIVGEDVLATSIADVMDPEMLILTKAAEAEGKADETRDRVRHTNEGLQTIAARLMGVRGRKNLLWISGAFPIVVATRGGIRTSLAPELNSGLQALNDANVAVYPIDARRLIGAFSSPASARIQSFSHLGTVADSFETLQLVADETGGRAFFNTNDISGAMRKAIDDGRVTYVLGYYPSHNSWNNRFRQLKVHVNRRGVDVRHRRGYVAAPGPAIDERTRDAELRAALRNALPATGIAVQVHLTRPEGLAPGALAVSIRIDPRGIDLQKNGERWSGTADLIVAEATAQGAMSVALFTTLTLDLSAEQRDRALRDGLVLSRTLTLSGSTHQLRVAARDVRTGAIGSLIVPSAKLQALTKH